MNLFKWTKNLKPVFPNVIEKFWGSNIDEHACDSKSVATVPSVNIADKKKAFEVSVAVPGLDKKDIKVEIRNQNLIISSEKQYEKEDHEGSWMRREYGYASFQRIFRLPDDADPDQVDASMKNGVLKLKVGKLKAVENNKKLIAVV